MKNDIDLLPLEELAIRFGAIKRVYENSPGIDRIEFTRLQLSELITVLLKNERKLLCERIKAEDDRFYYDINREGIGGERDHEMDANDCIKVILGEWTGYERKVK